MAEKNPKLLERYEHCRKWLEIAGNGWKCLEMAGDCLEIGLNDWKWLEIS